MCVACMCVHMWCAHSYIHVWKPEVDVRIYHSFCLFLRDWLIGFWNKGSHWTHSSASRLDWLVRKPVRILLSLPPSARAIGKGSVHEISVSCGNRTWAPMLAWSTLCPLDHLPNPLFLFLLRPHRPPPTGHSFVMAWDKVKNSYVMSLCHRAFWAQRYLAQDIYIFTHRHTHAHTWPWHVNSRFDKDRAEVM